MRQTTDLTTPVVTIAFTNIYHLISPESILNNFWSIGLGGTPS